MEAHHPEFDLMRRELWVRIDDEGRDKGKLFKITEMSAYDAEQWSWQVLFAMERAGIDVGERGLGGGLASVAALGVNNMLRTAPADMMPLLDRFLRCIELAPDPKHKDALREVDWIEDLEEADTIKRLRFDALRLHINFTQPDVPSDSTPQNSGMPGSPAPSSAPTSPQRLRRSSPRAAQA